MRSTSNLFTLVMVAGLAAPALAQTGVGSADPVLRAALKRVYPVGGPTDAPGPDVIVGEIQDFGFCCPDGEGVEDGAEGGAEGGVDHRVLLDEGFAAESGGRDGRGPVVVVAGEVLQLDGGVGQGDLDTAFDFVGRHGH